MPMQLHDAWEDAARRRRLATQGRRTVATVVAVRSTGRMAGSSPLVELELEACRADGQREWLTILEAVPLVRSGRAAPGATVALVIGDRREDGAMIDWST